MRAAILLANLSPSPNTIEFEPAVSASAQTIDLTMGELDVTETLTLVGTRSDLLTIDANEASRVLNITANSDDFAIRGLTLTGGSAAETGGAIQSSSKGSLTLSHTTVSGNSAGFYGGGTY